MEGTDKVLCEFSMAWIGSCKATKPCREHNDLKCAACKDAATRSCDETMGPFVCGAPLCTSCEHSTFKSGYNSPVGDDPRDMPMHVRPEAQKYEPWYTRQV